MKTRTADEIRKTLKETWPQLSQIWIFDHKLDCIEKDELKAMISTFWNRIKNKGEKLDCDDQALFFHADAKKYWANHSTGYNALCIGEVAGTQFQGWPDVHNQNIAIDDKGEILLIEPQTKEIFKANSIDDLPYWVRI